MDFWKKDSIQCRAELLKNPESMEKTEEAMNPPIETIKDTLQLVLSHPRYERNPHTKIIKGIFDWDRVTKRQRACLDIHYVVNYDLISIIIRNIHGWKEKAK